MALECAAAPCYSFGMSRRFRSCLARTIVTLVVTFALLLGSLFAPSHATAMTFGTAVVTVDDQAKSPCPMSMGHHAHHEGQTDAISVSDRVDDSGMPSDMHCCPALTLSPSSHFDDVSQVAIDIPLEMGFAETNRFGAPGIEPRPPRS